MQQYKTVLTNLYYYFKSSSVRSGRLAKLQQQILEQPKLKVREMHDIRWFSFYNVLEGIYKSWDSLVTYFDTTELSKDPKATGLRKSILQYQFTALTWWLMDVIPIVTTLNLVFQKENLDIGAIKPAVATAVSSLTYLRENDGHYFKEFKELFKNGELFGHKLQGTDKQKDSVISTIKKFIDNLVENINIRFPTDNVSVLNAFDCLPLRDLSFIPQTELKNYGIDKLEVLLKHYGQSHGDEHTKPLINADLARQE